MQHRSQKLARRDFLRLGGAGALVLLGGGALTASGRIQPARAASARAPAALPRGAPPPVFLRLAATDGHISLPGRAAPVYMFGFVAVPLGVTPDDLDIYKGNVQAPAPIIGVDEEADVYLTVTNIGLVVRPDLDDSHTVHWHGFPNMTAIFDGVPEVSIAVPVGRDFPYYYKPHRAGTFMYHCHFEDVEHVQMGMTGIIFVRPAQNGTSLGGFTKFAYNDGDGSTGYQREFALLLNEIWTTPHDNLEAIQETVWPDYHPNYWVINGRSYPDTLLPNNDPSLPSQPISSLIQVNPGERVLLRLANLGYEQHAMQLPGIPMKVVGEDATLLRNGAVDLSYLSSTIYIGPGEARDVLFTAPAFSASAPVLADAVGNYNRYYFRSRNYHEQTNGGAPGLGGMVTEVRVYQGSPLPAQTAPNQTYP
ncbi:MAG TPA: multicopper oxidase domain-containing protein [Roseiflexaceae bacterium]|nr:multicopper oxidase domain-containing protein [Roseiflexaceae bacterium]